ncbi:hypothetical protein A2U01_0020223, partial [Trifolium medium]|nr:hypothetical protein [Trifolium medium]
EKPLQDNSGDLGEINSKNKEVVNNLEASSTTKNGKSSSKQSASQQNRFSPLVDQREKGSQKSIQPQPLTYDSPQTVFKEQDLRLEAELNEELDSDREVAVNSLEDSSTKGSFVAVTQEDHSEEVHQIATPERVKKDMVFLKESWANMTENEENETRLIDNLEKDPQQSSDGFQVKMSKGQRKAKKRVNQSSKDSYATRSKVSLKPFK